jgi:hypothetical protein
MASVFDAEACWIRQPCEVRVRKLRVWYNPKKLEDTLISASQGKHLPGSRASPLFGAEIMNMCTKVAYSHQYRVLRRSVIAIERSASFLAGRNFLYSVYVTLLGHNHTDLVAVVSGFSLMAMAS